jgi:ATP-dependent RNA helicase DOB1
VFFYSLNFFFYLNKNLELKICEQQYDSIKIENEEEVARYYKLKKKLELVQDQMSVMTNEPKYLIPFLQPGRLVTVSYF